MRRDTVLLVLAALPAFAGAHERSCTQVETSQEIYECSRIASASADAALSKEYRRTLVIILKAYRRDPLGSDLVSQVKQAQLDWIRLRDSDCAVESFMAERGTQAYETTLHNCIARKSKERTEHLKRVVKGL